jgi:hypothetical protein
MLIDTKLTEDELIQQIGNNAVREAQKKSLDSLVG